MLTPPRYSRTYFHVEMEHYIAEISACAEDGTPMGLITYFLLNDESIRLIDSGAIRKTFSASSRAHAPVRIRARAWRTLSRWSEDFVRH